MNQCRRTQRRRREREGELVDQVRRGFLGWQDLIGAELLEVTMQEGPDNAPHMMIRFNVAPLLQLAAEVKLRAPTGATEADLLRIAREILREGLPEGPGVLPVTAAEETQSLLLEADARPAC